MMKHSFDWIGHAEDEQENFALMAYSNSGSDTEVTSCSKECVESYAKLKKLYDEQREQLGDASVEIKAYTLALAKMDKTDVLTHHKKLVAEASSDVEESPVYDRFANIEGMHAVPPPMTGNYMPPKSDFGIDESNFTYGPKQSQELVNLMLEETSDLTLVKPDSSGENELVWNNVQRLNHQNKFVPKAVLTKTGIFPVNTARQNPSSQAAKASTARQVNTARPIVNEIKQRNNFYKSHSPIRRPFNKSTAPKANFTNHKVNIVGDKTVSVVRGYREIAVKASAGCN
ncbi:hypothetical protein Tco_1032413 [Tanacetum coccineum]|uniref:Uncharacterized protein n=1 Tax=Tanacetum coccineum TaxID=301880 RepID=A0ABQ5GBS0_9ASTR